MASLLNATGSTIAALSAGGAAVVAPLEIAREDPDGEAEREADGNKDVDGRDENTLRRRERRSTNHFNVEYNKAIPIAATKH